MIYPTAVHTRFDHSLGTLAMALSMVRAIRENRHNIEDEGTITDEQEVLVRLFALLHDIAHIPFGHTIQELRIGVEQDVAYSGARWILHLHHAGPSGRVVGTREVSQAAAVASVARNDEVAACGDLKKANDPRGSNRGRTRAKEILCCPLPRSRPRRWRLRPPCSLFEKLAVSGATMPLVSRSPFCSIQTLLSVASSSLEAFAYADSKSARGFQRYA